MFFDGLSGESTTAPIFDKPVYDDDMFIPGMENPNSSKFSDVFSSMSSNSFHGSAAINDFLVDSEFKSSRNRGYVKNDKVHQDFDDLIPGFRGGSSKERKRAEDSASCPKPASQTATENSSESGDPFEMLKLNPSFGNTTNFLQKTSNLNKHGNTKPGVFPEMGGVSDPTDPLNDLGKITSTYSRETISNQERSSSRDSRTTKPEKNPFDVDMSQKANVRNHRNPLHVQHDSNQTLFEMPPSISQPAMARSTYEKASYDKPNLPRNVSSPSEGFLDSLEGVWLTVAEIPLLTMSTSAPPPSRPAPSLPMQGDREGTNFLNSTQLQNSTYFSSSKFSPVKEKSSSGHHVDIDRFFVENLPNDVTERNDPFSADTEGENSAANAMKDAMDRAEAKFRHAKIARERENVKAPRNREAESFNDVTMEDVKEKVLLEKKEMLERERQKLKEMEDQERTRKEQAHKEAVEKDKERQAVERATREARDRAANEARLKADRAAVEKANDEARVRAERAAVQRVQAEARERAANDAKERAEKAAEKATRERAIEARVRAERAAVERATSEARERAASDARERAVSEAREKAASEARERAASEARERAASVARERAASEARAKATAPAQTMNQSQNENDLDSFFSSRSSSAPKAGSSSEFGFESQSQNRSVPETVRKSASAASSVRKAPSAVNIVDDLTSIFGTVPSSSFEFQEIGGESEERRMARLERHQKTQERAAKALAEKNERDLQNQRDQAERHRIAETLDVEIKRWAAGKEANLRALLSTLQYVLWPDCGWQPLSLTDLINASSVKKAYRRATLCIHPDKVQQKGANLQQKYIAEKVFDLLKEAWNRFNSEELF